MYLPWPGEEHPPAIPPISPWGHRGRRRATGPRAAGRSPVQPDPYGVGCSGRDLERALEQPWASAWAGAQAPAPKDAPPRRCRRGIQHALKRENLKEGGIWPHGVFGSAELTVIRRSKSPSEVPDWSYLLWQRRLASRPPGSSVACFNPRVGLLDVEWEHV